MAKKIEAFHSGELFDIGQGYVVLARHRSTDDIEAGVFLVDVYCLGIKDAFYTRVSNAEYEDMLEKMASEESRVRLAPEDARKLIDDAIAYAKRLGFSPHRDYKKAARVLGGIKAADSDASFVFGHEGKPFYVQGKHDTPERAERIMRLLEARCGEDGFHYLLADDLADGRLPDSVEEEEPDDDPSIDDDIMESEWIAVEALVRPGNLERKLIAALQLLHEGGANDPSEAFDIMLRKGEDEAKHLVERWSADSPVRTAKLLAFESYEHEYRETARATANRALKVSSDCVEAWIALALTFESDADAGDPFEKAVSLAERGLKNGSPYGDEALFDRQLHLREYVRAKLHLAQAYKERRTRDPAFATTTLKHLDEAYATLADDPFRVRDWLVPAQLTLSREDEAERLLAEYQHEAGQEYWNANRALLLFRQGRRDAAGEALRNALAINPALAEALLDPESKSENEPRPALVRGLIYRMTALDAWTATDGALDWLRKIADRRWMG